MNRNSILKSIPVAAICLTTMACNDVDYIDQPASECYIMSDNSGNSLSVVGKSGVRFSSRMSNDTIYIKVNPLFDAEYELDGVVPTFFLSMGATVTPEPTEAQNFAQEGGVKYTVTSGDGKTQRTYVVTHGLTDILPYGDGLTYASTTTPLTYFDQLGYPGEYYNYSFSDPRQYGDLNGYVAFCGPKHVVLLACNYLAPVGGTLAPNEDLGLKVFNFPELTEAAPLNLGSITKKNIRAITSDWNGHLVATVAESNTTNSDIYYWTSPGDAPVYIGSTSYCMTMAVDGSAYIQAAGDVTDVANITCAAQRGATGNHHLIHLEGGKIIEDKVISTGYDSSDCGGFQMISCYDTTTSPTYVMGDCEGQAGTNNVVKVYVNDSRGTRSIMPAHLQTIWKWWVGTGSGLSRTGAKRPYVTSCPVNGKTYVLIMNGTQWYSGNGIYNSDLQSLAHNNARTPGDDRHLTNANWSYGSTGDMMWDEEKGAGYWIGWVGRQGLEGGELTCYE